MQSAESMRAYVAEAWKRRGWNAAKVRKMADDQVLAIYKDLIAEPKVKFYLDALSSSRCFCGESKKRGHSVCKNCFLKLPRHLQKALYQKIGHGYEQAHDRAYNFLRRN